MKHPPLPDTDTFLPLKPRDYEILFVLGRRALHGYGLVKEIEARTEGLLSLEPTSLYRRLRKLMDDGLVRETDAPKGDDSEGVQRRYYGITDLGRRVLHAEAARMHALVREARAEKLLDRGARST